MACENKISFYVGPPREVFVKCGGTDPRGRLVMCQECRDRLAPPKKKRPKRDPGYGRLYHWCKKNGFSYTRDQSYWDFEDDCIGTIGMNDGGYDHETVLEVAQARLATGNPHWPFDERK